MQIASQTGAVGSPGGVAYGVPRFSVQEKATRTIARATCEICFVHLDEQVRITSGSIDWDRSLDPWSGRFEQLYPDGSLNRMPVRLPHQFHEFVVVVALGLF